MVKNYSKAMKLGGETSLNVVESNGSNSLAENDGFSLYNEEILDASTPIKGRSISYLELTSRCNEDSLLSDTSLQRMRCLSQSISDMKILREKQQERRHEMEEVLHDDFLKEHARRLKEARDKIKTLEAKYQNQQRRSRTKSETSSLAKMRRNSRTKSLVFTESTGEEEIDGYSGSTQVQNDSTQHQSGITQYASRKQRPLTWASEDDLSFECNSLSSFGSNRQRMMERIPENIDWNRNCCYGDEGRTTRRVTPRHHSRPNPTTTPSTKWRSMPNLSNGETTSLDHQTLMYGEAIPLDPTAKKHQTKFTRKSGFYKVNDSPINPSNSTKKRKFRQKLFGKTSTSKPKKNSQKLVSSPKEGLVLGKVVKCHPKVESAYIIELNRPDTGTFGFNIRKGHKLREDGIFVCNIVDKNVEKFLGGLLRVGDEILEIDSKSVTKESLLFFQKLIKDAEKLKLTILPCSRRKDQQLD